MKYSLLIQFPKSSLKYSLRFFLKSFLLFFLNSCQAQDQIENNESILPKVKEELKIVTGAEQTKIYLPFLKNKTVGIVANQTSIINNTHLIDSLLSLKINIKAVYSPEHGFRGDADAGEKVDSKKDSKTGLSIVSLYGKNKKPTQEQLNDVDLMIFDIQDVGARFYTYISTLHYVMEACTENQIPLLVLDRPNPNGHYVDGPVLDIQFTSFVGMHPIPIVHGMTIGEYAQMINGEGWLKEKMNCDLTVIPCLNYTHSIKYTLPVSPSPNLRSDASIALYPSLCLFEGTIVSEGRGTPFPFECFGHPKLPEHKYNFKFTPESSFGAKNPKLKGELCYGKKLTEIGNKGLDQLNLNWLIEAYNSIETTDFFITKNRWFDLLAGNSKLRKDIIDGKSEKEIRNSWQDELTKFKDIRNQYLIYE